MGKHRPSLEAFAQQAATAPATATPAAGPEPIQPAVPAPKSRPHTTLYLNKKVQRVIKEIALQYDRKTHDLYLEGINLMLRHYGRPSIEEIAED